MIASANKIGDLYFLKCLKQEEIYSVGSKNGNENIWHKRFGKEEMVNGLDGDVKYELDFCKPCIESKHHRQKFPKVGGKGVSEVLELVHTDVCVGK